jgi:purine/pyrimidine-nucleoside phosphorylase
MDYFENVSITKKANVYFDGQVTSRTVSFQDGSKKTLGIMLPGEYEFNTDAKELMEITSGRMKVLLPGGQWQIIKGGESFEVPGNSNFQLKVSEISDYCCSFLD